VYFVLTGNPPFGDGDASQILARQLAERVDVDMFPTAMCNWFRRAFAPGPEERFGDGEEMQRAWKLASDKVLARQRGSWWRRVVS
jgi:eukaryotic-like serine/threonine-protein kinase